jgi:hypothetical protein
MYKNKENHTFKLLGLEGTVSWKIEVALACGVLITNLHQCLLCSVFTIEALHKMALKSMD